MIKTLAEQANLLDKPEQPWQKLRREVEEHQMSDHSTETRLSALENKLHQIELSLSRQLEALTAAYQGMAKALDQLVGRAEFLPVKYIVYGVTGSVVAGAVGAIVSRMLMK